LSATARTILGSGVLGGLAMGATFFCVCVAYPAGLGFGAVKLSPVAGIAAGAFGLMPWLVCLGSMVVFGFGYGAGLMLLGHDSRRQVAFAPIFLVGLAATVVAALI